MWNILILSLFQGLLIVKSLFESMFQKASFLATVHGAAIHSFFLREIIFIEELSWWQNSLFRNLLQRYSSGNVQLMISFCLLRYQLDGNGDGEPGVLMTAQTITSESLCTTTTTHITKVQTPTNTHPLLKALWHYNIMAQTITPYCFLSNVTTVNIDDLCKQKHICSL